MPLRRGCDDLPASVSSRVGGPVVAWVASSALTWVAPFTSVASLVVFSMLMVSSSTSSFFVDSMMAQDEEPRLWSREEVEVGK